MLENMTCKYCNGNMYKDDVDFNFPGNKDIYFLCDHCQASAIVRIRCHHIADVDWDGDED